MSLLQFIEKFFFSPPSKNLRGKQTNEQDISYRSSFRPAARCTSLPFLTTLHCTCKLCICVQLLLNSFLILIRKEFQPPFPVGLLLLKKKGNCFTEKSSFRNERAQINSYRITPEQFVICRQKRTF